MRTQPTDVERTRANLRRYFESESRGVELVEDGLKEISFGEYLVERAVVDRLALFCALQMQDRVPGARIGACVAALGYATIPQIEQLHTAFDGIATLTID